MMKLYQNLERFTARQKIYYLATEDVESTMLVTLLQLHQVSHAQPTAPQTTPKVKAEKVKRPSTTASGMETL